MIDPTVLSRASRGTAASVAATSVQTETAESAEASARYWSNLRRAISAGVKDRRLPVAQQGRRGYGRVAA